MKSLLTVAFTLMFCAVLGATPITINDPYSGSNPSGANNGGRDRFAQPLPTIDLISFIFH